MGIVLEQQEESSVIRLEGTIDIALAAELKATLLKALKTSKNVDVALDADADVDVTAIQLLWAAERESGASGVEFKRSGQLPEMVVASLKDAGIDRFPVPE